MKRPALILLSLFAYATVLHAAGADGKTTDNSFAWGARIGFAATGTYLTDGYAEGHKLTEYIQDTQVGNFSSIQVKWNIRKFLIQSGIGIGFNKSSFTTDKNSWNPDATSSNDILCSYSMISLMLPVQMGYNIVNKPPYCMSVFTGPRLRYIPDSYYHVTFNNTSPYSLDEQHPEFLMGWTAGFSVQIGRTFLDFEYEATINNISKSIFDTAGKNPPPDYKLDRRLGIISFSYGIMF